MQEDAEAGQQKQGKDRRGREENHKGGQENRSPATLRIAGTPRVYLRLIFTALQVAWSSFLFPILVYVDRNDTSWTVLYTCCAIVEY